MITIPLPWVRPPQSLNDRQHHHVKAKATAQALTEARAAIRSAKVSPVVGIELDLHYRVPDHRRRDVDNLSSVLKVCQDALVLEGVIPRDDWVCVPRSGCQIHPPTDEGAAMWLAVKVLVEYDEVSA
jgi:crossover junction endodeoxyribonuclease RusA